MFYSLLTVGILFVVYALFLGVRAVRTYQLESYSDDGEDLVNKMTTAEAKLVGVDKSDEVPTVELTWFRFSRFYHLRRFVSVKASTNSSSDLVGFIGLSPRQKGVAPMYSWEAYLPPRGVTELGVENSLKKAKRQVLKRIKANASF